MRETDTIANCGAVLCSAQANSEIVFRRGREATDFKSADVSDGKGELDLDSS